MSQGQQLLCPQNKHNRFPIKYMCLCDSCTSIRVFCFECLKEDKHVGHQSSITEIEYYEEYQNQTQNKLNTFIQEIQNQLLNATTKLVSFFEGLQQKYVIQNEQFQKLNVYEMNQAVTQMIRMKSVFEALQPQFFNIIGNLSESAENALQDLHLSQLPYIEKLNQTEQSTKSYRSEIISMTKVNLMNSQIMQSPVKVQNIDPSEYRKILLIGQAGVGKTKLFNQLKSQTPLIQNNSEQFQSLEIDEYQFTVIDTPPFEIDNDIYERESTIKHFSPYFYKNKGTISTLGIVVDYCEINRMKEKIIQVYKHIYKLKSQILVLVVDWEKCQDIQRDQAIIRERISKKGSILFIRNDVSCETLRRDLNQIIRPIPSQKLQLDDTLFENFGQ